MKHIETLVLAAIVSGAVLLVGAADEAQRSAPRETTTGAAPSEAKTDGPTIIPDPDPAYRQWRTLWRESRRHDSLIFGLKHEIAFLKTMGRLNLSPDQMQRLLPIARQAQADARLATQLGTRKWLEKKDAHETWRDEIMTEDLTPKKAEPTIRGNFEQRL